MLGPLQMTSVAPFPFRPELTKLGGSASPRTLLVIAFVALLAHVFVPRWTNNPMQHHEPFPISPLRSKQPRKVAEIMSLHYCHKASSGILKPPEIYPTKHVSRTLKNKPSAHLSHVSTATMSTSTLLVVAGTTILLPKEPGAVRVKVARAYANREEDSGIATRYSRHRTAAASRVCRTTFVSPLDEAERKGKL
jgi:hypothetical protein